MMLVVSRRVVLDTSVWLLRSEAAAAHRVSCWRPILADVEDDMVLETAVNGRADLLVTFNRGDFKSAAGTFALQIVSPAEAIERPGRS
jgi:predicted nucleic acid-binding protein